MIRVKVKHLILIQVLVGFILGYNLFCYRFINKMIDYESRMVITNYLKNNFNKEDITYKYEKTVLNKDKSMNIYIKVNKQYYRFLVIRNREDYRILKVDTEVPQYIKSFKI